MKLRLNKGTETSVLVLPDLHLEYGDRKSIAAVLDYAATKQWDYVIQLGDFLDWDWISKFNVDDVEAHAARRFKKVYAIGNSFLSALSDAVGEQTPKIIIEGNHDYRIKRLLEKTPSLKGTLEYEHNLNFAQNTVSYVPFWETGETVELGHATFVHGVYLSEYHARRTAMEYGTNVFYAHTHDVQEHSVNFAGDNKTIIGQSLGFLARYDLPQVNKGRPKKWQQAFAEFHFRPNGFFNHYVTRIFSHSFQAPDGRIYGG